MRIQHHKGHKCLVGLLIFKISKIISSKIIGCTDNTGVSKSSYRELEPSSKVGTSFQRELSYSRTCGQGQVCFQKRTVSLPNS